MKPKNNHPIINSSILIALISIAILITYLTQFTSIDIVIEDYYFDFYKQQFVYKEAWFAKVLIHQYVKNIIITFGFIWITVSIVDLIFPISLISNFYRIRLRFVAFVAVLLPSIISAIKHLSSLHCPWHLQRYGGDAVYIKLFDSIPPFFKAGHCFPAGHASTGLWLASLCIFWFPHQPRLGWVVFFTGLIFGFGLGWVQQMRGAHFLSHTLWSVWFSASLVILMLWFSQDKLKQNK